MCGIAGILTINHNADHLEVLLSRMQQQLQHRGPDDQGVYISPEKQVGLAHTRLSILDLSIAGHQPMSGKDGRYWITFNGEIYNFQELKQDLLARGHNFQSQTDTEVILKLYQDYGQDCVSYLRGMFAFAIWDNLTKTCFIARDPLGIKPLYYWYDQGMLIFASELRAVLASKLPHFDLSPEGLYGYLLTGTVPEPYTIIKNIYTLEAGNFILWKAGQIQKQQYWQLQFGNDNISLVEAQSKVRTALIDSVKYHFVSDVPVGIFLSGGIDSTSVLALARQEQTNKLKTYGIAFEETQWNEGEVAQKTAQYFETEHTEYKITNSIGKGLLAQFLKHIDQPSIDGFNTFCVSQIAHQDGTKVVLSGLGGDEFFGGYRSFKDVPKMVQCGRKLQSVQPIKSGLGQVLANVVNVPRYKRLGDFLVNSPNSQNAYSTFRGIFSQQEATAIARQYLPDFSPSSLQFTQTPIPAQPSLEDEVSYLEITHYMRNQLLRDSDVMSMAWGLELRVPMVDRILLETIASIPSNIRLASGKKLLIEAIPELPEWVVNRPKQGFFFPYQQWLDQEWRDDFAKINAPPQINLKLWYRRWCLAILQYWLAQR